MSHQLMHSVDEEEEQIKDSQFGEIGDKKSILLKVIFFLFVVIVYWTVG